MGRCTMTYLGACILGSLLLTLTMTAVAILAVGAAVSEASLHDEFDFRRAHWEEREALRILRARYAKGLVSSEEYRRLTYELMRDP